MIPEINQNETTDKPNDLEYSCLVKVQVYCNLYLSGRIAVLGREIFIDPSCFIMQVCGGYDREDRMLLCDECDQG